MYVFFCLFFLKKNRSESTIDWTAVVITIVCLLVILTIGVIVYVIWRIKKKKHSDKDQKHLRFVNMEET